MKATASAKKANRDVYLATVSQFLKRPGALNRCQSGRRYFAAAFSFFGTVSSAGFCFAKNWARTLMSSGLICAAIGAMMPFLRLPER